MLSQTEVLQPILETLLFQTGGDLHIIVNNALCGTLQGKRALYASFADSLATLVPDTSFRTTIGSRIHFHAVSSEAAIDAQAAFRRDQLLNAAATEESAYAAAVDGFQSSIELSGLPHLSKSLLRSLSAFRGIPVPSTSVRSSMTTISAAVYRARRSVSNSVEDVKDAQNRVGQLRAKFRTQIHEFKSDLFSDGELVSASTDPSRKRVESYLDVLKWWKLPWRVDELASDLASIINSRYSRNLERKVRSSPFIAKAMATYPPIRPSLYIRRENLCLYNHCSTL